RRRSLLPDRFDEPYLQRPRASDGDALLPDQPRGGRAASTRVSTRVRGSPVTFGEAFFGPGNRLRWEAIQAGSLSADVKERLGPFLDDLRRDPEMLVLPRVRDDDGRVQWYVLCSSARIARIVRDELRAFLGPSYSDFEGQPMRLDPKDPVEAALVSRCGGNAFRIEVPQHNLINAARERLRLAVCLRDERPVRHARRVRAAGR